MEEKVREILVQHEKTISVLSGSSVDRARELTVSAITALISQGCDGCSWREPGRCTYPLGPRVDLCRRLFRNKPDHYTPAPPSNADTEPPTKEELIAELRNDIESGKPLTAYPKSRRLTEGPQKGVRPRNEPPQPRPDSPPAPQPLAIPLEKRLINILFGPLSDAGKICRMMQICSGADTSTEPKE